MFGSVSTRVTTRRGSSLCAADYSPGKARLFVFAPTPLQIHLAIEDRYALADLMNLAIASDWPVFDESLEFAAAGLADVRNAGWGTWFAAELTSQCLVGIGGFHHPPDEAGSVEFGYALAEQARGRGLGTEFAAAMLRHAWCEPAVNQVIAHTMADGQISPEGFDNLASSAILRRLGFEHVGEDHGEWRWCLCRADLK